MESVARRRRPARGHAPVFALTNDLPLSNIKDGVIFARLQVTLRWIEQFKGLLVPSMSFKTTSILIAGQT